jgi:ABC-2 type transport system ATP-binding protein
MTTLDADYALRTEALGKRFRQTWALRDCTLALPAGRVAALVGPNGGSSRCAPAGA